MAQESMLHVDGLVRRYGDLTAVDGVSFAVARGEMFGLIGPDGAGKTTTLRVALGILKAHGGSVTTCGLDPFKQRRRLAHSVGYLSQRFSLYGDLSVDENVAFFARIHGVRGWRERREELLDLVRLTPFRGRLAARLSGGMKQKLALACTLIHRPDLLVLDEPTTGVDPVSRRDFWRLLSRLQRDGLTLVMTTPYLDEAERCQRVGLMHHGRLLALDDPQALRRDAGGTVLEVLATPRAGALEVLRGLSGVTQVETFGERLHANAAAVGDAADRLAAEIAGELRTAGVEVEAVRAMRPSLEDVFIARIRAADAPAAVEEVH